MHKYYLSQKNAAPHMIKQANNLGGERYVVARLAWQTGILAPRFWVWFPRLASQMARLVVVTDKFAV